MDKRVWNSPRVEPSMKAWRVDDTEDRERSSTSSPGRVNKRKIKRLEKTLGKMTAVLINLSEKEIIYVGEIDH